MENIKLIAVDIDGVILEDTFSPIIRRLTLKEGKEYTREIERHVLSQPRREAVDYIKKALNKDSTTSFQEMMEEFFQERDVYCQTNKKGVIEGAEEFLQRIAMENITCICYGGLPEKDIVTEFESCKPYFERYICTDPIRPGLIEITRDMYQLKPNQVLFIDDVNTVAEEAKKHSFPFVGIPAGHSWGFQKGDMETTGVEYIFDSVNEISRDVLAEIDEKARSNNFWH